MAQCTARIQPFPGQDITDCELEEHPDSNTHEGAIRDKAYPGSVTKLSWLDSDRRTFRGDWVSCNKSGCTLPHEHLGNHNWES